MLLTLLLLVLFLRKECIKIDNELKNIRDELFNIRMKIKLEVDSNKKLYLIEKEKEILKQYKDYVVLEKTKGVVK